jgi:hypothetical protein
MVRKMLPPTKKSATALAKETEVDPIFRTTQIFTI